MPEELTDLGNDVALMDEEEVETPDLPEDQPAEEETEEETSSEEEESEEKEEEEEEGEEKLEAKDDPIAPHERPTVSELKKVYPDIFKKFPSLKDMYFREQEFTRVFPTISEAKEAADNSEAFATIRKTVLEENDVEPFFAAVKQVDPESLGKISLGILPALYKLDPDAHWTAASPLLDNVVKSFYQQGLKSKDEDIQNAARHLAEYLFQDAKFVTEKIDFKIPTSKSTRTGDQKSDEKTPTQIERENWEKERYDNFFKPTNEACVEKARALIDAKDKDGKSRLDPDEVMTPFMKTAIIDKVFAEIGNQLEADKDHLAYMKNLWKNAAKSGYTESAKSSIVSAYLARVQKLVPTIRARFVAEALGTSSKQGKKAMAKTEKIMSRREPGTSGRPSKGGDGHVDSKRVDWSKTSDDDILNDRVTYKN